MRDLIDRRCRVLPGLNLKRNRCPEECLRVFKAVNHFKRELLQKWKKCNLLYFIPAKLSLNEVSLKAKSG